MREFSTLVSEALLNGLRPTDSVRDTMFFEDLYNLVPYEMALASYEPVTDGLLLDGKLDLYPFPQWFELERSNIVVMPKGLLRVDATYLPFDLSQISVKGDMVRMTQPLNALDYGDNFFLVGPEQTFYTKAGDVHVSRDLVANAALVHKNRTVLGGSTKGMWTPQWLKFLEDYTHLSELEGYKLPLTSNFIFWSSFDSVDFPRAFIEPEILLNENGYPSLFLEALRGNQLGFMEMPYSGAVLALHAMESQLFVFQENGITALAISYESEGATYGIVDQQPVGLKQRTAIGGDQESIVFIDRDNNLWYVAQGQGMRRLDFREYMKELQGTIYVTKDTKRELFYIGDGAKSFVLNNGRLTRVFQTVQVISRWDERLGNAFQTGPTTAYLKTESIDLGVPAQKTLTGVFIGTDKPVLGRASVEAYVNRNRISSPMLNLNPEGYVAARVFGKGHKIFLSFTSFEDINLQTFELKWQIDDLRQTRGIFATQDATGTGK